MNVDSESRDLEAVHRVLAGDRNAFRLIVEKYGDRVLGFLRSRLGSEEEAADMAQDVFLRVYRSLDSYRLGENFASWLFAIAANRLRTHAAKLFRERAKVERKAYDLEASAAADPVKEAERNLASEELRRAVALLKDELREVVELYYFAELSVAQTARVLGIGEEAAKSRLFRARSLLRKAIEEEQPREPTGGIL